LGKGSKWTGSARRPREPEEQKGAKQGKQKDGKATYLGKKLELLQAKAEIWEVQHKTGDHKGSQQSLRPPKTQLERYSPGGHGRG